MVNPRGRDCDDESQVFALPGAAGFKWLAAEGSDRDPTEGKGAEVAIALLEKHARQPFFLAVGFYRPHVPLIAPRPYFDLYPLDRISISPSAHGGRAGVPPVALRTVNLPNYGVSGNPGLSGS